MDGDDTIINPDFLSSTVLEDRPGKAQGDTSFSLTEELKAAFGDPHVLEMISKAVAAQILDPLPQGESTEEVVKTIFKAVDVQITDDMIDRTHRVGRKSSEADARSRPILVKFTSYRNKSLLMAAKKRLPTLDMKKQFPAADWPSLSCSVQSSASRPGGSATTTAVPRVYLNEDLTKECSEIAWMGRNFKRQKKIENTWVYDGFIFVKQAGSTYRVTTKREMRLFGLD
ncbi:hypothetical protein ACOMHN_057953 [Nucella lapillus]